MQLVDVAAAALPQFCRALRAGLEAAAAADPELGEVPVARIGIAVMSDEDGDHYLCSAEVAGESTVASHVHLSDLAEPERVYAHFAGDIADWIVETRFGWGLKLE